MSPSSDISLVPEGCLLTTLATKSPCPQKLPCCVAVALALPSGPCPPAFEAPGTGAVGAGEAPAAALPSLCSQQSLGYTGAQPGALGPWRHHMPGRWAVASRAWWRRTGRTVYLLP